MQKCFAWKVMLVQRLAHDCLQHCADRINQCLCLVGSPTSSHIFQPLSATARRGVTAWRGCGSCRWSTGSGLMVGLSQTVCCLLALALCGFPPALVVELASAHGQKPKPMWELGTGLVSGRSGLIQICRQRRKRVVQDQPRSANTARVTRRRAKVLVSQNRSCARVVNNADHPCWRWVTAML